MPHNISSSIVTKLAISPIEGFSYFDFQVLPLDTKTAWFTELKTVNQNWNSANSSTKGIYLCSSYFNEDPTTTMDWFVNSVFPKLSLPSLQFSFSLVCKTSLRGHWSLPMRADLCLRKMTQVHKSVTNWRVNTILVKNNFTSITVSYTWTSQMPSFVSSTSS